MARSRARRQSTARRGAVRVAKDWVYSTESYSSTYTLVGGPTNAQAIPLVYSQNTTRHQMYGNASEPTWGNRLQLQSGAAFPDHSKQRIYAIDGWMRMAPGEDWTPGAEFEVCVRYMHGEMDTSDALLSIQTGYSAISDTADLDAAQSANAGFLKEFRYAERVPTVAGIIARGQYMVRQPWRSMRGIQLGNDRGLFVYIEMSQGSIPMAFTLYHRTLMRAPVG